MKILGVDPGTIRLGVGLIDCEGARESLILAETVKLNAKEPLASRLKQVHETLCRIIEGHRPDQLALENVFFNKDVQSAIKIGEARAVVMLAASQFSVPVFEYTPAKVKQALAGNGQAKKHQVQFMVRQLFHLSETLSPDASDAVALALCHRRQVVFKERCVPVL